MWVILTAVFTGVLSGLGAGGGSLLVAALALLFSVKQHLAQGAVLISFLPIALAATVTHYRAGRVDLGLVGRLAPGSLAGAILGASYAARLPSEKLRVIFGVYLILVALYAFFNRKGT